MTKQLADLSHGPIVRTGSVWTVTGYAEATDLLNDSRLHADILVAGNGAAGRPRSPSLLTINGAEHKRARGAIAGRFTPRAVNAIRPLARDIAHGLIDEFVLRDRTELIVDFATPYVGMSTCAFLGFSPDEVDEVGARVRAPDPVVQLADYAIRALADRHRHPTNDILSTIGLAIDRGELPEAMGPGLVAGLMSAGHGPTINQLGIMVDVLSRESDLWRAVGQGKLDPGPVVEEVLRFRSTNQGTSRRVVESFEYGGARFVAGERIRFRLAAANHDPRRFGNPDHFDLEVNRGAHLAFGFGPHFCLGGPLARAQLQEALRALTSRITCPRVSRLDQPSGIDSNSDPLRPAEGVGIVGPSSLDIEFTTCQPQRLC